MLSHGPARYALGGRNCRWMGVERCGLGPFRERKLQGGGTVPSRLREPRVVVAGGDEVLALLVHGEVDGAVDLTCEGSGVEMSREDVSR